MDFFKYYFIPFMILLGVTGCNTSNQNEEKGSNAPNVILIMADDMGFETVGAYGSKVYNTPHLDQLAEEGVLYSHANSTPLCTPSRVKIMTGKHNYRNYIKFGLLDSTATTFGNLFKDAGYKTAVAGKWQLNGNDYDPERIHEFGFDEFSLWQLKSGDYWKRYKDPRINQNGTYLENTEGKYGPDLYTDFINEFIENNRDEPFFVYYPMCLPHNPFQPTPENENFEDFEIEGFRDTTYFDDMIYYTDKMVGKIVDKLEELELREETLVIFTADNGTNRQIYSPFKGKMIRGGKAETITYGTHVPLIASQPGTLREGKTSSRMVGFEDIVPTLTEAVSINLTDFQTDGTSFYPSLTSASANEKPHLLMTYPGKKSDDGYRWPPANYVFNKEWKLYQSGEFYHYSKDDLEENPLNIDELTGPGLNSYENFNEILNSKNL